MEDLEGHLWSQSFLRLISQSNDETKLRALQQIILHGQGMEQETKESSKKIKAKPPRKFISPKKDTSPKTNKNVAPVSPKIQKPQRFLAYNSTKSPNRGLKVTPIMGKWALLTKYNKILKDNSDAEIVTKIVMEKFKNILNNYNKRTLHRKSTNEEPNQDANIDNTQLPNLNSSEPKQDSHLDMDPLWEVDEDLEDDVFLQDEEVVEKNKNEVLDRIISIHDQLLEEDLEEDEASRVGGNVNLCDSEKLQEEELFEEKLQYDAQKFLEVALGDELIKDYSSVKADNEDFESSFRRESHEDEFSSINTSQVSNLCRASTYLFNMLSGKNRNRINTNASSVTISYEELFTETSSNSKASSLIREAAAQNQIILQTCKALNFCETSKKFKSSNEYIEAEKILLLATLKYEAAKKELHRVDYDEMKDLGQVTLSNLIFPIAGEGAQSDEVSQWCIGVVSCGSIVLASETVRAADCDIRFDKTFQFVNLDVDFEIEISFYTLYVKNHAKRGGNDFKFHTKQETTTCPIPNKLINFRKINKHSKPADDYDRRHSSFLLLGTCTLRLADLSKPDPFKLTRIPNTSILKGTMIVDLSSKIDLTGTYSGFLTIGSEAGGYATWNRRWCYLNGFELLYWNYPGEEHTDPIGKIDLRYCVASRVNQVDRELCARPRTLLLETGRLSALKDRNSLMVLCRSSYTITKHYLSADNHQEMDKWQNKLNSVVSTLRNWNCMKCQLYFAR